MLSCHMLSCHMMSCHMMSCHMMCWLQHLRDFPLYTEAIKFFNHSESMVRIAVRTLTLNVYKGTSVHVRHVHVYLCDCAPVPVWLEV